MPIHSEDLGFAPPHRGTKVSGLHGYLSRASVSRGHQLEIHASNDGPLHLQLLRLGVGKVERRADAISSTVPISELGRVDCAERHICCGSYVHVADVSVPTVFGLEIWFRQLAHLGCITFAAGSCMAALVLLEDRNFSDFMLNVLHRMGFNESRRSGAAGS